MLLLFRTLHKRRGFELRQGPDKKNAGSLRTRQIYTFIKDLLFGHGILGLGILLTQLTAHRIGAKIGAFLESGSLFFHHECFSRHPELQFHHFIVLVGSVQHMQINLGVYHTSVKELQFIQFFLNEVQEFGIRLEVDGLSKYFHRIRVFLRPYTLAAGM